MRLTARSLCSILFDPRYKIFAGCHKIQRVPPTEKKGRRQSSIITVATVEDNRKEVDLNKDHCRVDTYRDTGPGGQHRNKTDSAVRITHYPTGTVVTAVESRSQHDNREVAWKRLEKALEELAQVEHSEALGSQREAAYDDYNAWTWTDWRDEAKHRGQKYSMRKLLKGRLDTVVESV